MHAFKYCPNKYCKIFKNNFYIFVKTSIFLVPKLFNCLPNIVADSMCIVNKSVKKWLLEFTAPELELFFEILH